MCLSEQDPISLRPLQNPIAVFQKDKKKLTIFQALWKSCSLSPMAQNPFPSEEQRLKVPFDTPLHV